MASFARFSQTCTFGLPGLKTEHGLLRSPTIFRSSAGKLWQQNKQPPGGSGARVLICDLRILFHSTDVRNRCLLAYRRR